MSERNPHYLHIDPDRIYYGSHPDADVAAKTGQLMLEGAQGIRRFQEDVDTTNRNAEYSQAIGVVSHLLTRDGMDHSPIIVLSPEQFDIAIRTHAPDDIPGDGEKHPDGTVIMGRCLVREPETGSDLSKLICVIGSALHEAAHSAGHKQRSGVMSIGGPSPADGVREREYMHLPWHIDPQDGDFLKIKLSKTDGEYNVSEVGRLLEEGFAEYTKVRYMREVRELMGLEAAAPNEPELLSGYGIRVVNPDKPTPTPEGYIDIPSDYTEQVHKSIDTTPSTWTLTATPIAAYIIELLEKQTPGLYREMQKSRKDPAAYRNVVHMIESIQPGLYRQLRNSSGSALGNVAELRRVHRIIKS